MRQVLLVVGNVTKKHIKEVQKLAVHSSLLVTSVTSEQLFTSVPKLEALGNVKFVVMDELASTEWPGPDEFRAVIAQWKAKCWVVYQNGGLFPLG
jgi:hypothetical protein